MNQNAPQRTIELPSFPEPWERMVMLVDMDAFFASIEQRDHPEWLGRPICITNGSQGTTIITASYEARAFGIHTGAATRSTATLPTIDPYPLSSGTLY